MHYFRRPRLTDAEAEEEDTLSPCQSSSWEGARWLAGRQAQIRVEGGEDKGNPSARYVKGAHCCVRGSCVRCFRQLIGGLVTVDSNVGRYPLQHEVTGQALQGIESTCNAPGEGRRSGHPRKQLERSFEVRWYRG